MKTIDEYAIDLAAIRARVDAASPGPWFDGDVWLLAGVTTPNRPGRCAYCDRLGDPVWAGKTDINGTVMDAHRHRHRDTDPYARGHRISSGAGGLVAGNYDVDTGGIIDPDDAAFIIAARQDVSALLDALSALDGALHSVWLHGDWRWLTKNMTTEQREAAADAVERHWGRPPHFEDGPMSAETMADLRWWRP